MPDYETLDLFADSYNPALALVMVTLLILQSTRQSWRHSAYQAILIALLIALVYLVMAVDNRLQLYAIFGLDYSTHTAVATILVLLLSLLSPPLTRLWLVSLLCYLALILYQGYHTVEDIVATLLLLTALLLPSRGFIRLARSRPIPHGY